MIKSDAKSATVRYRPRRGDKRDVALRGVIYISGPWIGMEVKVVRRTLWASLLKRLHKAEAKLNRIGRIANGSRILDIKR